MRFPLTVYRGQGDDVTCMGVVRKEIEFSRSRATLRNKTKLMEIYSEFQNKEETWMLLTEFSILTCKRDHNTHFHICETTNTLCIT